MKSSPIFSSFSCSLSILATKTQKRRSCIFLITAVSLLIAIFYGEAGGTAFFHPVSPFPLIAVIILVIY